MTTTITFSQQDFDLIDTSLTVLCGGTPRTNLIKIMIQALSLQLKKEQSYMKMNEILNSIKSGTGLTNRSASPSVGGVLVDYTSEDEVNTMFRNAYENGDTSSSLLPRDRLILRLLFVIALGIVSVSELLKPEDDINFEPSFNINLNYNSSTGEPEFASRVFNTFPDKSRRDILTIGTDIVMNDSFLVATDTSSTKNIIKQSFDSFVGKDTPITDIKNAVTIGPAYIIWIAKNKWNIDWSWTGN